MAPYQVGIYQKIVTLVLRFRRYLHIPETANHALSNWLTLRRKSVKFEVALKNQLWTSYHRLPVSDLPLPVCLDCLLLCPSHGLHFHQSEATNATTAVRHLLLDFVTSNYLLGPHPNFPSPTKSFQVYSEKSS